MVEIKRIIYGILIVFLGCSGYSCNKKKYLSDNSKLIWDFTENKDYIYSYSKNQESKNKTGVNKPWDQKYLTRVGKFYIQSTKYQLANLFYPNALTSLKLYDEKTNTNDTMSFLSVGFVKYNIKQDESIIDSDSLILFPKFSKKLEKGNKDTLLTYFKFNAPITKLVAKGYNTLECSGDTTVEKRKCLLIKGKIEVSNILFPKDFNGDLKFIKTGYATYYFDNKNHCYVGADINLVEEILVDKKATSANESNFYLKIKINVTYKIRLDEIKRNLSFMVNPRKIE